MSINFYEPFGDGFLPLLVSAQAFLPSPNAVVVRPCRQQTAKRDAQRNLKTTLAAGVVGGGGWVFRSVICWWRGGQQRQEEFVSLILGNQVRLSMDGKGRALDNVFIERLWRSAKQEFVYIFVPESGRELHDGLSKYFDFYNYKRKHQSLNNRTPSQLFLEN